MAHIHNIFDAEPRYVIDPVTRLISKLSKGDEVIVQGDHNSERFTFEVPRWVDGHDMSTCDRVEIHYINIGSNARKSDIYKVNDLQFDPDDTQKVICSWLIAQTATSLSGSLNFVLRFVCTSGSTIEYAWNTLPYTSIKVGAGINNSEELIQRNNDILQQWYSDLVTAGNEGINKVEEAAAAARASILEYGEQVKNSIPSDYASLVVQTGGVSKTKVMSQHAVSRDFANSVKKIASGLVVRADDVSPVDHPLKITARSKNLVPTDSRTQTVAGVTVTVADGIFSVAGTATGSGGRTIEVTPKFILRKGRYTISSTRDETVDIPTICIQNYNTDLLILGLANDVASAKFEIAEDTECYIGMNMLADRVYDASFSIQIERGSVATEYIPYVNVADAGVTCAGKNLIPPIVSEERYGYTVTRNGDGTITITGSANTTNSIYLNLAQVSGDSRLKLVKNQPYTISGGASNGESIHVKTVNDSGEAIWGSISDWKEKTYGTDYRYISQIYVESTKHEVGDTSLCGTYWVQLEVGDEATPFEAYKFIQTTSTDSSGKPIVDIQSTYPTMTVYSDVDNLILDVEYNRDTNSIFSDMNAEILEHESRLVTAETSRENFEFDISRLDKRMTNIEQMMPAESFLEETMVAYERVVPTNAASTAMVTMLGGMSKKSNNLIPFPYISTSKTSNGITFTVNEDRSITIKGTATSSATFDLANKLELLAGKRYWFSPYESSRIIMAFKDASGSSYWGKSAVDWKEGHTFIKLYIQVEAGKSIDTTIHPMLNVGSSLLPYEPYFEGLMDAKATAIKSVGVNLFDKDNANVLNGYFVEGGALAAAAVTRTVYIKCNPNTTYTVSKCATARFFVGFSNEEPAVGVEVFNIIVDYTQTATMLTATSADNSKYLAVFLYHGTHDTLSFDEIISTLMINKGSTALPYTPYKETVSYPVPEAAQALDGYGRGVGTTCYNSIEWDENGKITWNDRISMVDMGTLNWKAGYDGFFAQGLSEAVYASSTAEVMNAKCSMYDVVSYVNCTDKTMCGWQDGNCILVKDSAYTDPAAFKAAMSGIMLYYERKTSIVTDVTDIFKDFDNLIPVSGQGAIVFENEHKIAIPSEIVYQLKGVVT